MDQKQLRALVARMHEHVGAVTAPGADDNARKQLSSTWDSLVQTLALEPLPAVRSCPNCGKEIMKAATMCGYCWTKSVDGGAHA